ncbi:phosphotransferase family protein [uncultured Roseibium sp.]|uniref:phosphotransferase family protein n=1 Tax=uncultured Roseibium sp. TaxID=1936171 RepID=UPI003216ACE7
MEHNAQHLDTLAVERYLKGHLPGFAGPLTAEKFAFGQSNPTFRLTTPEKTYVLRRKPPGVLLKSAHAIDREFRVQKALAGTDVPVADMLLLCEDDSVIGTMFYVMEHVNGRHFDDPSLPGHTCEDRAAIFDEMNRVLAALHSVDLDTVGLSDFGAPGAYVARQIDRWTKQYRASETETIADMDALISWLNDNVHLDDGQRTLVHGDYRIDNMIFESNRSRVAAVLDWELSTLGHPVADLAYQIMQWRMPVGEEGRGLAGLDRKALGIPSEDEYIARYCERRGLSGIPNFNFFVAFCFFRMGAILQGVKKRALDGNASNPERGLKMGEFVPFYAAGGLKAVQDG